MSVRAIRPGELDLLLELCAEHAAYERCAFTSDGQIERWRLALDSGRLHAWVIELDGSVQGFAAVSHEYSTWRAEDYLHLDCLYLRAGARGRGLGSKLFTRVIEHARESGCRQIQWQTPPWNEKAVAFYDFKGASSLSKLRFSLAL